MSRAMFYQKIIVCFIVGSIATILIGAVHAVYPSVADCALPDELTGSMAFAMNLVI